MVELSAAPYDYDGIPLVPASVVSIDAELEHHGYSVTAEAVPASPLSSLTDHVPPGPHERSASVVSEHSEYSRSSHSYSSSEGNISNPEDAEKQRKFGAGAAGAVIGLFMGGPVLSVIFGVGGLYYAGKQGATGDVARAMGDVALVAQQKWKEVDRKHHIVDKGRAAATEAIDQMKESDRKHKVKKKLLRFVGFCWHRTVDFVERHRLIERGAMQVRQLVNHILEESDEPNRRQCR